MSSTSQSLLHTEARERRALLDVTSYDVTLDLAGSEETFDSRTVLTFESRGGRTFLDVKPVTLRSARLNDQALDVDTLDRGRLPLDTVAGTNVVVVEAVMPFRNDGEGLHAHTDPADGKRYVYGMSFMDAAPTIFACFDQPDLKAPYTLHVRAPHAWTVVGNAPASNPEPGRWEIGPTQPLSTYFVTVVAGPYHVLHAEHDGIALSLSCRASLSPHLDRDADELFTMTGQCFDEFHRLFGIRYPFGDYHQAFVPEFNAGAMENPGCVTFRDEYVFDARVTRSSRIFRATTIAHEMAHQWFGNIVTPQWWDDLWLNESFAEYLGNRVAAEVTQYTDAASALVWARRQWGLLADQRSTTHPVAGNGARDAVAALEDFDGISYAKGSTVLRQLNTAMGDDVFLAGAIDHFERHRFDNATMHDLFASWERAGAGDLGDVVTQWLRTAGPDTFTLDRAAGVLHRTPPPEHPAQRSHTFDVARHDGRSWSRTTVHVDGPETPLEVGDDVVVIDPAFASWGVYVPDERTIRGLVEVLPGNDDGLLVAAAWNNVKSGYSVAAVDPDAALDLVEAAFPAIDTEDTLRHTMWWLLAEVLPVATPGGLARVHAAARRTLASAAPSSDLQLSAFRAVVRTCEDAEALRAWQAELPVGIEPDRDVRWRLLTRLAMIGACDADELDAALADDPSTANAVSHAEARAALPTPEAKQWAWDRFTGVVDVPNYELEAAGYGLWSGPPELLAAYVTRYVSDLPGTARVRSGWNLAQAAEAFFPAVTDESAREQLRTLLPDGVLEPAVRRRVLDQLDGLERRLAVRAAFPKQEGR